MIKFLNSAKWKKDYPLTDKEVVFVGRSNVGKSSLINALYGKVAYVGKTPGKTKLLNFFKVDDLYTVCDVPGYGYAARSEKEIIEFGEMMDEYFNSRTELKLCILILDIRRIPNNDDLEMVKYLNYKNIPILFVLNKIDKVSNNGLFKQKQIIMDVLKIDCDNYIITSTLKRKNIDILRGSIIKKIIGDYEANS